MAISFPSYIYANSEQIAFISADKEIRGVNQTAQMVVYPSYLHKATITIPPLVGSKADAMDLFLSKTPFDECLVRIEQPRMEVLPTMSASLSAAASNDSLPVTGINAASNLRASRFVSVVDADDGRRYLYKLKEASTAGNTARTLKIIGTVRKAHAAGSVVEITQPFIQGRIADDSRVLSTNLAVHLTDITISISEMR